MNEILKKLDEIARKIDASETPRMCKERAAKYLCIGLPKLKMLVIQGKVQKYIDGWGAEYYLKDNLDAYLKSNEAEKFLQQIMKKAG